MSSVQAFLAEATRQAADQLIAAFERIPEDKREWSPIGGARTALDQLAECAILTGVTAELVEGRAWPAESANAYMEDKSKLVQDAAAIAPLLAKNTARVVAAIGTVTDSELEQKIDTAFGPMSWQQLITYPYWNMSYHLGQINYLGSMLGCLA